MGSSASRIPAATLRAAPPPAARGGRGLARAAAFVAWTLATGASAASFPAPRIVIDPGHGGGQLGAVGTAGLQEKSLCLDLSLQLAAELERRLAAQVTLTRRTDRQLALSDRVALANASKPDLFISLHANSMPTRKMRQRTEGIETFFLSPEASGESARRTAERENAESLSAGGHSGGDALSLILSDLQRADAHADSSRLAYAVHQSVIAATGAHDRGVQQAPFFVLSGVDAAAVLVEVGFVSHPHEGRRLLDPAYQQRLVGALAQGIERFLEQVKPKSARRPVKANVKREAPW